MNEQRIRRLLHPRQVILGTGTLNKHDLYNKSLVAKITIKELENNCMQYHRIRIKSNCNQPS